jgi:type II secretory pathway component PulM
MNFQDMKEESLEQLSVYKEKIQESAVYIQIKERYDQLNPKQQKYVNIGSILLIAYIVLSIPLGSLSEANSKIEKYKEEKKLLANFKKAQEAASTAPRPQKPQDGNRLSRNLRSLFEKEGLNKDQIGNADAFTENNTGQFPEIPKEASITGVKASLKQLNIKQLVDILKKVETQSTPSKMTHLNITPTADKAGFFDVAFELRGFDLPIEEVKQEETSKRSRRRRGK